MKKLWRNKNYIGNGVVFAIVWGLCNSMAVILTPLFAPGDYSTSSLSLIGVTWMVGGVVSMVGFGVLLDRTKAF